MLTPLSRDPRLSGIPACTRDALGGHLPIGVVCYPLGRGLCGAAGWVWGLHFGCCSGSVDRDRDLTRIEPGTLLAMRTNESMDSGRRDYRVYSGIVDEHVRR